MWNACRALASCSVEGVRPSTCIALHNSTVEAPPCLAASWSVDHQRGERSGARLSWQTHVRKAASSLLGPEIPPWLTALRTTSAWDLPATDRRAASEPCRAAQKSPSSLPSWRPACVAASSGVSDLNTAADGICHYSTGLLTFHHHVASGTAP